MASFSLRKKRYRIACHLVEALILVSWLTILCLHFTIRNGVLWTALHDWLGPSVALLLATSGIPEGTSAGLSENPPGRIARITWASSVAIATTLAWVFPWLSGEARDLSCSYWYEQDFSEAYWHEQGFNKTEEWGEEKRRFNLGVFWADSAQCWFCAFIVCCCVVRKHPPSCFTRCAVRFLCSIWLETLIWMMVGGVSLCGQPGSVLKYVRELGRSLAMWVNAANLLWVSMLILRRMKALDVALHCAVSPRRRSRRSSSWMTPLLVGFAIMNTCQFTAIVLASLQLQKDSFVAYKINGAILHAITDASLIALTVALHRAFREPLWALESEAHMAGDIPGSEALWALSSLRHERNMILLTMVLTSCDIFVRSFLGFFPSVQKTLPGFMTYIVTWDFRNCTDAATMAALCGFALARANEKWGGTMDRKFTQPFDHRDTSCTDPAWTAKVEELAGRGVRLENLLDFLESLLDGSIMPTFNPDKSTTNDVVRQAIIPQSRDKPPLTGGKAMATVWNNGEPVWPMRMVTHSWANLFLHLVAAVVADAMEVSNYFEDVVEQLSSIEGLCQIRRTLQERGRLGLAYWICAFSVNQHAGICAGFGSPPDRGTQDRVDWERKRRDVNGDKHPACTCREPKYFNDSPNKCEMNKFDDMIVLLNERVPGFAQVIAVDREFTLLHRCWCLAEIVKTSGTGTPQNTLIHSCDAMDLHYDVLSTLDVRHCQASHKADKDFILSKIPDIDAFNERLQWLIFSRRGIFMQHILCPRDRVESAGRIAARISRARKRTFSACRRAPSLAEMSLEEMSSSLASSASGRSGSEEEEDVPEP